jgi:iron complex outermembrane receptor protein
MYKQLLFLISTALCFLLAAGISHAQTVEGRVVDTTTSEPLAGATILEKGTNNGTSADDDGNFSLTLTQDNPQLTVSYVGYRTKEVLVEDPDEFLSIRLDESVLMSGEIFVSALRVDESTPIAYSNISRADIEQNNMGQDIPYLVQNTPSVVSTSDAGAGIGYTGLRIRGVDPGRINVTINGIPLNDSESHGVFWVNMPDLASSTQNIQIQRGVGTSTHGAGAFGATLNLQTAVMDPDAYGEINTGLGAYGTRKANVKIGSGLMNNGWQVEGRLSKIESDGYIDRARSDLRSFYLSASRSGERSLLKADVFSGQEETYQAWNGVPEPILENDAAQLEQYISDLFLGSQDAEHWRENLGNRRFNEFTYQDQVDNYQQDHYQLHYSYMLQENWTANASLHYTYGRGYFEQFRNDDDLSTYSINPVEIGGETVSSSDLVRRRWLDNHFYGAAFSSEINREDDWKLTVGGGYNEYDGDHFGEVIWARFAGNSELGDRYYNNNGFKTDFNIYGKLNYYLTPQLNTYLDLQYRSVTYRFLGLRIDGETGEVNNVEQRDQIPFFNPKAGIVYRFADIHRAFASVSVGGKEPTRRDYVESTSESRPKEERLIDFEAGYQTAFQRFNVGINAYYMLYQDQLINTGEVNDVGNIVRENVPDSYRAGIELQLNTQLTQNWLWSGNATFSRNKIDEYQRFLDDFDSGGQQVETYENVTIAFSPSVIANSSFTYQTGDFSAEWNMNYVSEQFLDNTENISRSIDPYLINNLLFTYEYNDLSFIRGITASLQINNVLDEKYVANGYTFGWIAEDEEKSFNYYYPQAGRHVMANLQFRF